MEKTKYEKPIIEKVEKMTFMFESLACIEGGNKDSNCSENCPGNDVFGCRQCSSCHGCR